MKESQLKLSIDAMVSQGLVDLGYEYFKSALLPPHLLLNRGFPPCALDSDLATHPCTRALLKQPRRLLEQGELWKEAPPSGRAPTHPPARCPAPIPPGRRLTMC